MIPDLLLPPLDTSQHLLKENEGGLEWPGDRHYTGINSTVLGGIEIGNDVMIAPNTFVNQDIPSHSIVIGNPCKIIHKEEATKDYVFYKV